MNVLLFTSGRGSLNSVMLLAAVSFIPHIDHEEGELVLVAEDYLTALVKNGQIHGNFVSGWVDGVYTAYVHVSHRDAHKRDSASQWVRRTENLVRLQYGASPEWEIVDDETSLPVPQLSSAGFIYLMSHAMHEGSPVWHGQRGTSLPMPLLPISDRLKEEIYHWALVCRSYDQIWMMEGPLADAAWRQLSDWSSEFYQEARRLGDELQLQTSKPCFIYLWNDFPSKTVSQEFSNSDSSGEISVDIKCPGCEEPWEIDHQQIPSREPFRKFHYRCNSCRIVSHETQVPWHEPETASDPGVIPPEADFVDSIPPSNAQDETSLSARVARTRPVTESEDRKKSEVARRTDTDREGAT